MVKYRTVVKQHFKSVKAQSASRDHLKAVFSEVSWVRSDSAEIR